MAKHIKTSIQISASKEKVWKALTDFSNYKNWNPFITSISGDVKKEAKLLAHIQDMKFKPVVLTCDENKEFTWLGKLFFKGLFDGKHQFRIIENNNDSIIFEQNETFTGILVPLFAKKLDQETKNGFNEMNLALKKLVENS